MHKTDNCAKNTKKMDSNLTIVNKVSVQRTLLTIKPGENKIIKTNLIKASSIRSAIRCLNKKGYSYKASEKGLIDEIEVSRIN